MSGSKAPRWDLTPIFSSLDGEDYKKAKLEFEKGIQKYAEHIDNAKSVDFRSWLVAALKFIEDLGSLGETLQSYVYAIYSTATLDQKANTEMGIIEEMNLPLMQCDVRFKNVLALHRTETVSLIKSDAELKRYAFFLEEELFWQEHQMDEKLEELAEDLNRSGGDAWGRLQQTVSSNSSIVWDEKTGERKTMNDLRGLAFDADRSVREKAFKKELEIWKNVEIPMAAALNGVKGFTVSLNRRRGFESALEKSIAQARITQKTLDALITAMKDSQGIFRRYLKAKAKLLGIKSCAFYDLFAPVGKADKTYTWEETEKFIVDRFSTFSKEFGAFAQKAFTENWIDAEVREGKVGGAYCTDLPKAKVPRVLCNFEGSFSSLTTVAHELGHAFHYEVVKNLPYVLTKYPMTLAETASIFAETVVFEDALKNCTSEEKLGLIEIHLQDGCQIIVDILSRFLFESKVFEKREKGEVSANDFSALMEEAQKATYGDGLDPDKLHPYMWAVKGHYYSPSLSFYNFPYAFGQLFGLGLYARYKKEGADFAKVYRDLLSETGSASAVDVCKKAGFDIETVAFWKQGLSVFENQMIEFERLVDELIKK